jgi:uncharacterized protein involved in exopolysaccharide biosynthesis
MDADPVSVWYRGGGVEDVAELMRTSVDIPDMALESPSTPASSAVGLSGLFWHLLLHWRSVGVGGMAGAAVAAGLALVLPPTFTARAVIIPPQQQGASAALGSLGALAGLAGGLAGIKTSADQYISLLESATIVNVIVDRFDLIKVYDVDYRIEAQKELANRSRLSVGKKDGLIFIEVDDKNAQRAADIANTYVEQLRRVNSSLAVSEAQQRRVFFERQLTEVKDKLAKAQAEVQGSGLNVNALKTEPRSTADAYAKLKNELMVAEIRQQVLEQSLVGHAPELQQQRAVVSRLRSEMGRLEKVDASPVSSDYVAKYREYKYQEGLFEFFAKQYESARVDESREGAFIQVVDAASAPEKKSKPKLSLFTAGGALAGIVLTAFGLVLREGRRKAIAIR